MADDTGFVRLLSFVQELIGKNVTKLMPAVTAQAHSGYMERYLRTGEARAVGKRREVSKRGV